MTEPAKVNVLWTPEISLTRLVNGTFMNRHFVGVRAPVLWANIEVLPEVFEKSNGEVVLPMVRILTQDLGRTVDGREGDNEFPEKLAAAVLAAFRSEYCDAW